MWYRNEDYSNVMAEAPRTWCREGFAPARHRRANIQGRRHCLEGSPCQAPSLFLLCWVVSARTAEAWPTPWERVDFKSAPKRLNSTEVIPGERIQGYLAKPGGAGPFPAVIGLHGCAGMDDTTKQRLTE